MHVPLGDAPTNACADDSVFEPNQTLGTAWPTPVGASVDSIAIAGLAICPASDTDHFRVTLSTPRSLVAIASWDSGVPVKLSILDSTGSSIGDAIAMGMHATRICLALPAGSSYPIVQTGNNTTNNYRLELALVASCN